MLIIFLSASFMRSMMASSSSGVSGLDFAMTKSADSPWPFYMRGQRDHIHAIGVVALNFNRMELLLHRLLYRYLGTESEAAHAHICRSLNLHSVLELFNICVAKEKSASRRDHLRHFSRCYEACAANRNILMHSDLDELESTEQALALFKRSGAKPHIRNQLKLSIEELRRVADEIFDVYLYGSHLFILNQWNAMKDVAPPTEWRASPKKPAIPRSLLAPSPSTRKTPQPQP
jgi:hypothetical protein